MSRERRNRASQGFSERSSTRTPSPSALCHETIEIYLSLPPKSHVLAFDNVSGLPPWLSDALCRIASGGGFSTRQLYTDADEVLFEAQRPIVVNGIEDFVTRADLADQRYS